MTHAELREQAAKAIYEDEWGGSALRWADAEIERDLVRSNADAVLRVVLDALREVTPCEACGDVLLAHPVDRYTHDYVRPAHLAVLEEDDRGL